jgi:predicted SprT family Zn-dependent metalloprotease
MNILKAQTLALQLMDKHGLLAKGWSFSFDNAKRRYGLCQYRKKHISLSRHLTELNSDEQTTDTILHEIAHALAGPRAGHYSKWKYTAMQVGAKPQRCYGSEVLQPEHKWLGTCPNGHETKRMKRMKIACSKCCVKFNRGKYTEDYAFTWTENIEIGLPV